MSLSIIIPTLNERENIKRLLRRLKKQMTRRDEVIVVDGYSKDGTGYTARKEGAIVVYQKPIGIGGAKTEGAKYARHDILVFLDADCIPSDGFLEKIRCHFSSLDIDMVGGQVYYGTLLYDLFAASVHCLGRLIRLLAGKPWVSPVSSAIKRETFLSAGGFRSVVSEDLDLARRLPRSTKVVYDSSMVVLSSPRRFNEKGFLRTVLMWGMTDIRTLRGKVKDAKGYRK